MKLCVNFQKLFIVEFNCSNIFKTFWNFGDRVSFQTPTSITLIYFNVVIIHQMTKKENKRKGSPCGAISICRTKYSNDIIRFGQELIILIYLWMLNDVIFINSIVRGDLNLRHLHWKHNVVLVGNTTRLMEKQNTKS